MFPAKVLVANQIAVHSRAMRSKRDIDYDSLLPSRTFKGVSSFVHDREKFDEGVRLIRESVPAKFAFFQGDDMIAWGRTMSFLDDPVVSEDLKGGRMTKPDSRIVWRTYILANLAKACIALGGDLMEVGCYAGRTAEKLVRRLDLSKTGRTYWLYDLFDPQPGDGHIEQEHHGADLYESVRERFADHDFVRVVRGRVPDVLSEQGPERVCFAHVDLNNPEAEVGALEWIIPRMAPGGMILLDDYGWLPLSNQKKAIDAHLAPSGREVIELPTGQGLLIVS